MKFLQTENFSLYSNSFCKFILSRTLKIFAVAWLVKFYELFVWI